jgi:ubiquinone biosynthesis protein Coq4
MMKEPSADKVLALEQHLTRLATDADVDKYLSAMRACAATSRMLDERYLPTAYTLADLERCAPGTLGHAYREHMIENDLRPDFFEAIAPDDDFAYTRLRLYQTHDVWHAVTGYPTTMLGEAAIVGFYLGHFDRHMGDRAGAAAAFSAILAGTVVMNAALFRQDRITHVFRALVEGWGRGQAADPFFAVRWEEQWDRPLTDLRAAMHVGPSRYSRPEVALAA